MACRPPFLSPESYLNSDSGSITGGWVRGTSENDSGTNNTAQSSENAPGETQTEESQSEEIVETFNGYPVVYLTPEQEALWEGSYNIQSTTCADNPTSVGIVILDDKSSATITYHFGEDNAAYQGRFISIEGSTVFYFDIGTTQHGLATADGSNLGVGIFNNSELSAVCNDFFFKL